MATSSSCGSPSAATAAQRLSQLPEPPSPSSYRLGSRNTSETSGYGLIEDDSGEAMGEHPLTVAGGSSKGKQRGEDVGSYAEGGGDMGVEEMMSEGERERRRKLKGKGRMQVESAVDEEDVHEVPPDFAPEEEEEDAQEEQRIAENLARWSKAESTRRKSVRNSSTLVLPSAPPLPSASTLARRSSALIRAGSKRLSRIPTGRDSEEMALTSPTKEESRRRQRRGSVKLEDTSAEEGRMSMLPPGAAPPQPQRMEHLVEGDEATTPPASIRSNPFTSPPPSASARSASFDTASTIDARHQSLFIEDLPLQSPGISPTKPKPSSINTTSLGTRSSLDSTSPSPMSSASRNPFADGFALHSAPSSRLESHSIRSRESQETITPSARASRELGARGVRSSAEYERRMYRERGEYAGQQEEEERDSLGGVGFLDWLLCGCFRSKEGDEQAGRTNPNE